MMAAVTYFIAGKSNCPFFAKAQRIGEIISRNLPSVAVRITTQHPQEWPAYIDSLCSRLKFSHKSSPVVYTHLGSLIGGSDAFYSLVNKMYGNLVELPTSILNDIAAENHEHAEKERHKQQLATHRSVHDEQWDMRNERLKIVESQIVAPLNSQTENISKLFQTCQSIKATLTVAPEKSSILGEPVLLQKHLATISASLPNIDKVSSDVAAFCKLAASLDDIPSTTSTITATPRYSRTPDTIWKLMLMDHQKSLDEFVNILKRMHETNEILQGEATKLAQVQSSLPSSSTSISSTSNSSFSIPVDKLHKSVSYAGVDTQYSPKDPSAYYSLPSTPKKEETPEVKNISNSSIPLIDVVPLENAIKAMRTVVDEGLLTLKNTKKQLRVNLNTANKQVTALKSVLHPEEYRLFKLRERKEIGKNVHLFRFELPSPDDVLGCTIGKHIKVRIGDTERAYSPISTDTDRGYFDLAVKVTRDTPIMDLFANLGVGDWVQIRGPAGDNIFKEEEKTSGIAMFAHGVGLTPMLQVIRHYLSQSDNTTPLWLLYFNAEERMIMKEELERLSAAHTRFNLRILTSKPGNHWEHLQAKDLVASLPFRPSGFDYSSEPNQLKILICGTKNFAKKTKALLEDMGYRDESMHIFE